MSGFELYAVYRDHCFCIFCEFYFRRALTVQDFCVEDCAVFSKRQVVGVVVDDEDDFLLFEWCLLQDTAGLSPRRRRRRRVTVK